VRVTPARRVEEFENMGEFTDKLKGAGNQVAGDLKQGSADPAVRDQGRAQETKGDVQEIKGKVKGVINKL
jgi:uncharacterized protein YjbJ (UPF0337 family)